MPDLVAFGVEVEPISPSEVKARYDKVKGSAVNPVLREGNADRRAAVSVKKIAQKHPHKMMKPWPESGSKSRVAHMSGGDFFESEKSTTLDAPTQVKIEFVAADGSATLMKDGLDLQALLHLQRESLPISQFDRTKLGPNGRVTALDDPDGVQLRNTLVSAPAMAPP